MVLLSCKENIDFYIVPDMLFMLVFVVLFSESLPGCLINLLSKGIGALSASF